MLKTNACDNIKKKYQKYTQNYAIVKNILVLKINLSILINDCISNSIK